MKKKIADIQIFRALAIIFVLLQHLSITSAIASEFPVRFTLPFYVGVELFFIISGYVVAKSFFSKNYINPFNFLVKRVFRIYPALIFFIFLSFLVNLIFHYLNLPKELSKLFLVSWSEFAKLSLYTLSGTLINWTDRPNAYLFGAIWSLSVEFQFYTCVAIAGSVLLCIIKKKNLMIESLFFGFCILTYIFTNTLRIIHFYNHSANLYIVSYIINWNFDFLLLGFAVSIAEKRGWLFNLFSISRELSLFLTPLLITLPLALISISESPFAQERWILQGFSLPISGLCFAVLVYIASTVGCFPGTKTRCKRILSWIGDRSYSIYLFHFPVMALTWILLYQFSPSVFNSVWSYGIYQVIITLLLLLPLVELVYVTIEMPFIEYSRKLINQKYKTEKLTVT